MLAINLAKKSSVGGESLQHYGTVDCRNVGYEDSTRKGSVSKFARGGG